MADKIKMTNNKFIIRCCAQWTKQQFNIIIYYYYYKYLI